MTRPAIVAFGECMLELSRGADGAARLAYGGDTLNTAVYMARLGLDVRYATALGNDPWSEQMREAWRDEGLDLSMVLTDPQRAPGLYAISTDAVGERSFTYWRSDSAARQFFRLPESDKALASMARARLLYLSGITLSLFDDQERNRIADVAKAIRAVGGDVAFDPNYRARNWPSAKSARDAIAAFASTISIALPTHEDEAVLHGDESPQATLRRWRASGVGEIVVKVGPEGALLDVDGSELRIGTLPIQPTDTTGAGDSFNAAYLHGRLTGASSIAAVHAGNALALKVIQQRGAIIARDGLPSAGGPVSSQRNGPSANGRLRGSRT